jgi:hypothetical protein
MNGFQSIDTRILSLLVILFKDEMFWSNLALSPNGGACTFDNL